MRKPSLVIGKKQILLAGMTLMLGIAVYANYAVTSSGGKIKATDKIEKQSVNYGEAELVNADKNTTDYFSEARIERMNARDEAKETLKNIMGGGDATEEEKAVAAEEAAAMTGLMESESKVESLVKAAGFTDCVCYLDGENANIVVQSGPEGLIASEAAQIKDILLSEVTIPTENIRIFDVE
ncbi:SpoIIIAH-like family protein [Ruminococcus sp.]|uniref:SpoIIIAH-like family protein n=1 Tax=Ruminococcus sp. TaxID=41978 RepID=UPI0025DB91C3|nr:SpoIIIAH-like family protein [Ruminococcus sp.]MBQ8965245.1 SpoIIIAH-like family protein [Ruminococcus sp.]